MLLTAGANPNRLAKGSLTPMTMAANLGRLEMMEMLLKAGACPRGDIHFIVESENEHGRSQKNRNWGVKWSPFGLAAKGGQIEACCLLSSWGVEPQEGDLKRASLSGNEELIGWLLSKRSFTDETVGEAQWSACRDGFADCLKMLVEKCGGLKVFEYSKVHVSAGSPSCLDCLKLLVKEGEDIEEFRDDVDTEEGSARPLMAASRSFNEEAMRFLVDQGADLNGENGFGLSAFARCFTCFEGFSLRDQKAAVWLAREGCDLWKIGGGRPSKFVGVDALAMACGLLNSKACKDPEGETVSCRGIKTMLAIFEERGVGKEWADIRASRERIGVLMRGGCEEAARASVALLDEWIAKRERAMLVETLGDVLVADAAVGAMRI
jgi:ankyrin repeat protein